MLKNHPNIFECFFKNYKKLSFFKKKLFFFTIYNEKNLRPEEKNIIKNIRNLFRLEKETKGIKNRLLRDIKNLFQDYYKPVTVNNSWSNNYIDWQQK